MHALTRTIVCAALVAAAGCATVTPSSPDTIASIGNPSAEVPLPAPASEAPAAPKLTMAKFQAIQTGMTYQQAVGIIGFSGEEISRSEIAGYSSVMYMWRGDGYGNMNAMFQNGKLISKAQFGLK